MLIKLLKDSLTKIKNFLPYQIKGEVLIYHISFLLLMYAVIMAATSSISYDEAYTYMRYSTSWAHDFFETNYANNHPLNSILIYLTAFFFPYNEFAIRLPNLIFLLLYLVISAKIATKTPKYKLLVFGLLVFYWMLIPQYFSLARGYGISTALVLLFLMYFKKETESSRDIIKNFYILMFASYAFTGLLPVVVVLAIYYLFFEIKFDLLAFIKKHLFHLVFLFVNYMYIAYFLISVSSGGKPVYGSNKSFSESITGYYIRSFSKLTDSFPIGEIGLIFISVAFFLLGVIMLFITGKKGKITFVTLFSFAFFYIASKFSGQPYITGRLLLPLYPLVVLSFIEILDFLLTRFKSEKILFLSPVLFGLLLYNYIVTGNFVILNLKEDDYNVEVYKKLNFNVVPPYNNTYWASLEFYKRKLYKCPPFEQIDKMKKGFHYKVPNKIELFYLKEKSLLFLIADSKISTKERFHLHIGPKDLKNIEKGREQWDFNNFDFNWTTFSDKYMYVEIPNYEYSYIRIGQKDWSKKITIANTKN